MISWDSIDPKAAHVLKRFKDTGLMEKFYLSGGTALALQLGHRVSVDLDFFSQKSLHKIQTEEIMTALEKTFPQTKLPVSFRAADQIWLEIEEVKTTFLAYPFERKHPLIRADGILLADVRDIALQKAFAVGRRAAARDYVDLACILRSGATTLEEINADAREVFVEDEERLFSPRLFMQQLVYTEDLEDRDAVIRLMRGSYDFDSLIDELRLATGQTGARLWS